MFNSCTFTMVGTLIFNVIWQDMMNYFLLGNKKHWPELMNVKRIGYIYILKQATIINSKKRIY